MKRIFHILNKHNLDAIILTDRYNINYLTKYMGDTGVVLIYEGKSYLLTDSRYIERASNEAKECICIDILDKGYSKTICELLNVDEKIKDNIVIKTGFENNQISYSQYKSFADALGKASELVELNDEIDKLRMIKSDDEISLIAKAEAIGDEAFSYIVSYMKVGMTEKEIALQLEFYMKKKGADGLSFETICASGENSSMPHATPTDRILKKGDFVTMDFGCIYNGYCSDMTRTVMIGNDISDKQKEVYETVLKAQKTALKAIKPGVVCSDVDKIARDIIKEAGYGKYFGHGLGHSVGLFIHEEPRLSGRCNVILQPGMTVTVEPGIYLPGEFGVRIEDLVVVTEDGYKNLTTSDKKLIMIQ